MQTVALGFLVLALSGCGRLWADVDFASSNTPRLSLQQSLPTITEGDSLHVSVTLSIARASDTIVDVSLTSPRNDVSSDFDIQPPATVTIPAGHLSTTIDMHVDTDAIYEGTEDFLLSVSTSAPDVAPAASSATLSVHDSLAPPVIQFQASSQTVNESTGLVTIDLNLSTAVSVDATANVAISGTAAYGVDHDLLIAAVTIPSGMTTGQITFHTIDDLIPEGDKTLSLSLTSSTNCTVGSAGTHTVTIADDDVGVQINQAAAQGDPTNSVPVRFAVVFSQAIDPSTFTASDVAQSGTATGVTWSLSTGDNITWALEATAAGTDGTLIPTLPAGRVQTSSGFLNLASSSGDNTVTYDTTDPTVAVNRASGQVVASNSFPLAFTVIFDEPIQTTSFTAADITQIGTATGITWTIADSGDSKTFTLKATAGSDGSYVPEIAAGSVTDLAGNLNDASTWTDDLAVKGLAVIPRYAHHGANWNDTVRLDGTNYKTATDSACTASQESYTQCFNGGEMKMLIIPGVSSCSGLSATDALGAFSWADCDTTRGLATFYTRRLTKTLGLRELLKSDGSGWKTNSVTVAGSYNGATAPAAWWTNTVLTLPDNSGAADTVQTLSMPGAVYVLTATRGTQGYNIAADGVSVVTLAGSKLTYAGSPAANCNSFTGLTASPDGRALLCGGGHDSLWIELDADGDSASNAVDDPITIADSKFSQIRNSTVLNSGFELASVSGFRVYNLRNSRGYLSLDSSLGGLFQNIQMNSGVLYIADSDRNVVERVTTNNAYKGLSCQTAMSENVFTRMTLSSTEDVGIQTSVNMSKNIFSFLTIADTDNYGFADYGSAGSVLHNIVITNANNSGLALEGVNSSVSQLVVANNQNAGIYSTASYGRFSGFLRVGNNSTACSVSGTAPGIDASCHGTDLSTGTLTTQDSAVVTTASEFVGGATADDLNGSDTLGSAAYPGAGASTFDWLVFANPFSNWTYNPFRFWTRKSTGSFPDSSSRGSWLNHGGNGQIFDYTLLAAGTILLNHTGDPSTANATPTDGTACPAWLGGNVTVTDISGGEVSGGNGDGNCEVGETCGGRTFLTNAYEVSDDDIGNDNSLCESGETCVAAPNFGSYQGHGTWQAHTCLFQNGAVTGVEMHFMPSNGL